MGMTVELWRKPICQKRELFVSSKFVFIYNRRTDLVIKSNIYILKDLWVLFLKT